MATLDERHRHGQERKDGHSGRTAQVWAREGGAFGPFSLRTTTPASARNSGRRAKTPACGSSSGWKDTCMWWQQWPERYLQVVASRVGVLGCNPAVRNSVQPKSQRVVPVALFVTLGPLLAGLERSDCAARAAQARWKVMARAAQRSRGHCLRGSVVGLHGKVRGRLSAHTIF